MREDVRAFVEQAVKAFDLPEPIAEIGSYQAPGQQELADLRPLFPGKTYLGCDAVAGPGVDRIEDIHRLSFPDAQFGTALVVETLEHVADPYVAIGEVHRVLRPGGIAILSIPFNFPIHHMPDYTRLTPEGMSRLLTGFGAHAVFFQGDAQHPHTVYAVAQKSGSDVDAVRFETAATRLQTAWDLGGFHDPLVRFQPLQSVARWDQPDRPAGDIALTRRIEQQFVCRQAALTRIDINFDLIGARSPGALRLRLRDGNGAERAAVEMPARYVWHERWVAFQFPAVDVSAGTPLRFAIECSEPAAGVAVLASKSAALPDAVLFVDGEQTGGTVSFEAFGQRPAATAHVRPPAHTVQGDASVAQPPATLEAARIQAAELHYTAALLHAEIARLRNELADVSRRVDQVNVRVVDELAATLKRYWPVRVLAGLLGRRSV